jgi:predicted alpha-1,6-mannanase (GH76 family)
MGFTKSRVSLIALSLAASQLPSSALAASRAEYTGYAVNASDVLNQQWYDQGNGQWQGLWWNSANALTAIADLAALDWNQFGSTAKWYFENTFKAAKADNGGVWTNHYYDDGGWWAMCWIRAYDLTNDAKYLDAAKDIFEDYLTALGANCGGVYWSKDREYEASIANELYLETAASLANRVSNPKTDYRKYAQENLDWFMGAGLVTSKNVITDGITEDNCKAGGAVFTYNQGVILGGLVEMSKLTKDQAHIDNAHRIAGGAIDYLTDEKGILREKEWPGEVDETGAQFKGIFVRKLAELHIESPRDRYADFLRTNADGVWANARASNGTIGSKWQGPYDPPSMATQSSGLDLLVAAARVST